MSDKTMQVSVVAADKEIWSGAAKSVVAKTLIGEIGLLPGHEPMLAILGGGEVRIITATGESVNAATDDGGFLSMEHDVVTVVMRDGSVDA